MFTSLNFNNTKDKLEAKKMNSLIKLVESMRTELEPAGQDAFCQSNLVEKWTLTHAHTHTRARAHTHRYKWLHKNQYITIVFGQW